MALVIAATLVALGPTVGPSWLPSWIPRPVAAYIGGQRPMSWFPLFPWGAWSLVGLVVGHLWLRLGRDPARQARVFWWSGAIGAVLVGSVLLVRAIDPEVIRYPSELVQQMGPGSFFFRLGLIGILSWLGWLVTRRSGDGVTPMRQLGRTSLLIYWIHVEICYGFGTRPIQKQLGLAETALAFGLLCVAMFGLSVFKTRFAPALRRQAAGPIRGRRRLSQGQLLRRIFLEVAERIDGARLVEGALDIHVGSETPLQVLALGKVAGPMVAGLLRGLDSSQRLEAGLVIAPEDRLPAPGQLPAQFRLLPADHPIPSERSLAAGEAVRRFVSQLRAPSHLLVLLSGGGSALAVLPRPGLTLDDKRAATRAVARGGATISELNTVRKHLSALKGGQLGLACQVPVRVLALSDVVGNDPGTIASGPVLAGSDHLRGSTFAVRSVRVRRARAGPDRAGAGSCRRFTGNAQTGGPPSRSRPVPPHRWARARAGRSSRPGGIGRL